MPRRRDVLDGCEAAMGDGTADGAGKGESGVEGDAAELLGVVGHGRGLLETIKLCIYLGGHCVGGVSMEEWRVMQRICATAKEDQGMWFDGAMGGRSLELLKVWDHKNPRKSAGGTSSLPRPVAALLSD